MSKHNEQQGCIGERMLSDIDLLAALDGEASSTVMRHLSDCACCTSRAALLVKVQRYLRGCLSRLVCPSTLTLIDYYLQLLDPAQYGAVAAHLLSCQACGDDLARIVAAGDPLYRYVSTP